MKLIIKNISFLIIVTIAFTLFANLTPLSVAASVNSAICPDFSVSPTNSYYDILPMYDETDNVVTVRECVHNFTKQNSYKNIEPSITVLTHGLGGDPSHWANNNVNNSITYDSESLIEQTTRCS